jgi:glutathione S-transferase
MITFYHASGSPFARRVWLSLEHKALPYEEKLLSFAAGDLSKPEYLAINPRHRVPAIVDDGFALYESVAIVEYLDQRYPDAGQRLFPPDPKEAAIARRLVQEFDHYYAPAHGRLLRQTLVRPAGDGDANEIAEARKALTAELEGYERALSGEFFVGASAHASHFFGLFPATLTSAPG